MTEMKDSKFGIERGERLVWDIKTVQKYSRDFHESANIKSIAHRHRADYWGSIYLILGLLITGASAVVGVSIFSESGNYAYLGGYISVFLVVTSSLSTFLNPNSKTNLHHRKSVSYKRIAARAAGIAVIDLGHYERPFDEIFNSIDALMEDILKLDAENPRLSNKQIRKAKDEWDARPESERALM